MLTHLLLGAAGNRSEFLAENCLTCRCCIYSQADGWEYIYIPLCHLVTRKSLSGKREKEKRKHQCSCTDVTVSLFSLV